MAKAEKTKILIWGDYCCSTGFATVVGNVARELQASGKYEIDVLAINYAGDPYDRTKWPGDVWPAISGVMAVQGGEYGDVYGRRRLLDLLASGKYNVLFMVQDTFVLQPIIDQIVKTQEVLAKQPKLKSFKTVFYFPIDAKPMKGWAETVKKIDFPIAYTNYAKGEIVKLIPELEQRLRVIYHGTNLQHFYPIPDKKEVAAFRKRYLMGKDRGRFLIVNVNRNQPRKDIPRTLMVLRELKDRGRDVVMYLHMQFEDTGGNIFSAGNQLGLGGDTDYLLPHPRVFNANQGIPVEDVNLIYNMAGCVLSTTLGEGWGLSVTEAMATKTPVVVPDNTSLTEMCAEKRAILIPSGETPSAYFSQGPGDFERLRPLMNVEKTADAIEAIMDGKGLPDVEGAYDWVRNLNWQNISKQFMEVIDLAATKAPQYMSRQARRAYERQQAKVGAKG